jgi:hypothetical protein
VAVEASPSFVSFGDVTEGSPSPERRVHLTVETEKPVHLTPPQKRPNDPVTYSLETDKPGRAYDLVIRLANTSKAGPFFQYILLSTDNPMQKTVRIGVRGRVVKLIRLQPTMTRMRPVPPSQPFRAYARLINNGKRPVKVVSAKADTPEVKVTVKELEPGRIFQLQIQAPGNFTPPPRGTRIHVKTDDPKAGDLTFTLLPAFRPPVRRPRALPQGR